MPCKVAFTSDTAGVLVFDPGAPFFKCRNEFSDYDAALRFDVGHLVAEESELCRAGEVLRGVLRPTGCPAFGDTCTPEHPMGAPMVSSEGACAAYYRYGRLKLKSQ